MKDISQILTRWTFIAAALFLGGVAGLIISFFMPVRYDATVGLNLCVDYAKTGRLDDNEQDRLLGIAEDIINSEPVFEAACHEMMDDNDCSADEYRSMMRISRTHERWMITVNAQTPERAARMVIAWLSAAHHALTDAQTHAIAADALIDALNGEAACLTVRANGVTAACPTLPLAERMGSISHLAQAAENERILSKGFSAALLIGSAEPGELEIQAAGRTRGFLTAMGALAGFCFALMIAVVQLAQKKETENAPDS